MYDDVTSVIAPPYGASHEEREQEEGRRERRREGNEGTGVEVSQRRGLPRVFDLFKAARRDNKTCMYIYIIYVYVYVYIKTCMYIYIYVYMYMYVYV